MPTDSKIIGKSTEHISAGRNRMPNRCLHTDGSPDPVVTFLFTDVEGSSKHWQRSPDAMRLALARHDEIISASIAANSGHVFKTIGDAFCAAFESPTDALNAVIRIQTELFAQAWSGDVALRVRAALNSGQAESRDGDYYGHTVNVVSRLLGLGHGGQTLVSAGFHALALPRNYSNISFRDLGSHRLKGIDGNQHVYQLNIQDLPTEFPALRAVEFASTNLPQELTDFVGREKELAELARVLSKSRLVSLVGPGGIGKTRLALHVASEQIENYIDGVWLVALESIMETGNVVRTIASTLGVHEEPGRDIRDQLRDCIHPKPMLLLLDNCEHVIDECGMVVTDLLQTCPDLTILTTTQEALKVAGEVIWPVPALSSPPAEANLDTLMKCDASKLFIARASLSSPSLVISRKNAPLVARICAHLDGIPLAIELAAARVNALSLEQIAQRLDDRFRLLRGGNRNARARHQTLRATLDWSYDLLSPAERLLLNRVSVFVGGWTLEAAEAICGASDLPEDVLDLLVRLVDKSMVIFDTESSRYRILETIRQYAAGRLFDSGEEDAMQSGHAQWFSMMASSSEHQLWGADQATYLQALEGEIGNLRATLLYYQDKYAFIESMRTGADLYRFWAIRGYINEGLEWLTRSLDGSQEDGRSILHARALSAAGGLAWAQCQYDRAYIMFWRSLEIRTELDDKFGIADTLNNMGQLATDRNNPEEAREFLERSLVLQRELNDNQGISSSLSNLALHAQMQGDDARAEQLYQESLALDRKEGDHWSVADTLCGLARIACRRSDPARARKMLTECLKIRRQISDKPGLAESFEGFGRLIAKEGDYPRAILMWGAAEAAREVLMLSIPPLDASEYAKAVAEVRAHFAEEAFNWLWQQGRKTPMEKACQIALEYGSATPTPSGA